VKMCGGNRSESARRLGISPRRLRRLLSGSDVEIDLEYDCEPQPGEPEPRSERWANAARGPRPAVRVV